MAESGRPPRGALALALALVVSACSPAPSAAPLTMASSPPMLPSAAATPTQRGSAAATPSATAEFTPGTAIVPGAVDRSSLDVSATYDVDIAIAVQSGAVAVEAAIRARNDSGAPIDRLELNTIAARLGDLRLMGATIDGQTVTATIDDQTLLVPLGGILPDGASTTVRLRYTATLRPNLNGSNWLFSRAGGTLALYRWIPWVSRAVPFTRPNHGDPFVTPSSPRVTVTATTDVPMILAAAAAAPVTADRTWSFEARDVRDVALILAPDFTVATGDADGIAIRAFTRPGGLDGDQLRGHLHPGRERPRRPAGGDGHGPVLDRAPRLPGGEPVWVGGEASAPRRSPKGEPCRPAADPQDAVPVPVLTAGRLGHLHPPRPAARDWRNDLSCSLRGREGAPPGLNVWLSRRTSDG